MYRLDDECVRPYKCADAKPSPAQHPSCWPLSPASSASLHWSCWGDSTAVQCPLALHLQQDEVLFFFLKKSISPITREPQGCPLVMFILILLFRNNNRHPLINHYLMILYLSFQAPVKQYYYQKHTMDLQKKSIFSPLFVASAQTLRFSLCWTCLEGNRKKGAAWWSK